MAEHGESWFVKLGVLFDGTGFKKFGIAAFDVKKTISGLYDSFKKITSTNSSLYNTAKYLSMSTDRLQVWENAFSIIGGSAEDAQSAINSLNFAFDKLRLGEAGGLATVAARLKLRPEDLTSFETMIEALNRSYNTYFKDNYGQFKVLAEQMGLSKSAILLVTQSANEYQQTMRRASNIPLISERHLKAFRRLESRFYVFSKRFDIFKAQAASSFAPAFERILGRLEELMADPEFNKALGNMFNAFEEMFNQMSRTENLEGFIKLVQAAVDVLTALVNVAAKVPDAMGWVGDKVGTLVGYAERRMDASIAKVQENIKNDPLAKAGIFNPFAGISRPAFVPSGVPQIFKTPAFGVTGGNITLNQENHFAGKVDESMVDEIASRSAEAINRQAAKRDIEDMRASTPE